MADETAEAGKEQAMNATPTTPVDPVLQRLHEVTARIRLRAAESRERAERRARGLERTRRPPAASRSGQAELPLRSRPEEERSAA
jgi:hypothetical protein